MKTEILHNLNYASLGVPRGGRSVFFRTFLVLFAVTGAALNLTFIGLSVQQLHRTLWVYHELMQNSRAYGREIDPAMLATLSDRRYLCAAFGAVGIACTFGLLLATSLFIAAISLKSRHDNAVVRLAEYRRWKPIGAAMTALALCWASEADLDYWVAATRHIPVGSGPPIVETMLIFAFAMLPWWWVFKEMRSTPTGSLPGPS